MQLFSWAQPRPHLEPGPGLPTRRNQPPNANSTSLKTNRQLGLSSLGQAAGQQAFANRKNSGRHASRLNHAGSKNMSYITHSPRTFNPSVTSMKIVECLLQPTGCFIFVLLKRPKVATSVPNSSPTPLSLPGVRMQMTFNQGQQRARQ